MAAKLLHSLTDDNPDLQKQIGCMTGIFQLFDRQQILTGGRRVVGHGPKRLPHGNSHFHSENLERESNNAHLRSASMEKYSHKNIQEKQRISTESSRPSFSSSSRTSSFSSIDCNRPTQLEPASFDRIIFPETPSRDPSMSLQNSSSQFSRQSLDIRDLVKDSMYREVHGLSVKANKTTDEAADSVVAKYRDSPRMPSDLKESLKVLAKLQEAPWYQNEPRELLRSASYHAKEGSSFSVSRDAPRFSYDGREINRAPFDSRDVTKSALKLKDVPRLSLDSREGSMRAPNADSKSNFFSRSIQKDSGEFDSKVQNQQQTPGNQTRPPSVVAKLMGLETLPDSVSSSNDEDFVSVPKPDPNSTSVWKEPSLPRWRNPDYAMKPMSRFPIEPAPWKQMDGMRSSQKQSSRTTRAPSKAPTAFPSVYSEIEKRLKDLEFTQSGKDLRALKQILEAMQSKGYLETEKESRGSNFTSPKEKNSSSNREGRLINNQKLRSDRALDYTKRRTDSAPRHYESPILVDKSAASVISLDGLSRLPKLQDNEFVDSRKALKNGRTANDNTKNDRTPKSHSGSGKSSGSISPRMQQKKLDLEKRSRPPTPPESSKSRRQPNKQQGESNSPGGRRRPKLSNDQLSEVNVESRYPNHHDNENSVQSSESIIRSSKNALVANSESPSMKASSKFTLSGSVDKSVEIGFVTPEYSSPVSVLDKVVCKDDSPSPVKYVGKNLKADVSMDKKTNSNVIQEISVDSFVPNSTEYGSTSDMNRKKLQNIENLVQKLRRLNSSHDEAHTDYIASLCENTNPDHRYISEILLASGLLLRELGSNLTNFQFHPSGHPINPELFLVLEQTKASTLLMIDTKLHRKLIFDALMRFLQENLPRLSRG
ncbi:hypothetical protein DH2020_043124 [Rehmannia glutinosa]|uniref:Uncharacterized protein n=1 Tax=Rehmannia glutinosa TaxID=99300 RepID=A0ABR0UKH1_REHGL